MSIQNTYHKFISLTTITVMLWNIIGWLGFGLVLNHSHEHGEANHCEVTFCYCEIEDGQSICTCHHNDMKGNTHHSDDAEQGHNDCYFSVPHTDSQTASQALVNIAKVHAFYLHSSDLEFLSGYQEYQAEQQHFLQQGTLPDLLRPPRG